MIRINILLLLIITGGITPRMLTAQNRALYAAKNGSVVIKSDAPLELIEAASAELKGVIDLSEKTFAFTIQNRSFKGFNSPLQQEHFYENYIEANRFPTSTFKGKIIEQVDLTTDGNYQVRAKGLLFIHGVEQERIIRVELKVKNRVIQASSAFTIPLSDHNINIPKIVHRKIAEEISVKVALSFSPEPR
jgi:polyisoprenoid-binding protein YceI